MRRLLPVLAAGVALSVPASAAAATHAVSVADFAFSPGALTVAPGDTVQWRFAGPDTDHSVTGMAFNSDPGKPSLLINHAVGYTFSHVFPTAGRFTYVCRVHDYMHGTVVVRTPGSGTGSGDTTPPKIRSLKGKRVRLCKHHRRRCFGTSLRFKLSEPATVHATVVSRAHPRKVVRSLEKTFKTSGRHRVLIRGRGLHRARYRVTLVATDDAGNTSGPYNARFRVRP